jgi:hypothetical protein
MKKTLLTITTLLLSISAFSKPSTIKPLPVEPRPRIEVQQWGGEGISMQVVKETRGKKVKMYASIQLDCAKAYTEKIILDNNGGFLAQGTHTQLTGIYHPDHPPVVSPIHIVGYANKGVMTLVGISNKNAAKSQSFVLKKGSDGNVHHCQ